MSVTTSTDVEGGRERHPRRGRRWGVSCRGGSATPPVISCTLGWGQDIKKWELPPPFLKPSEVTLTGVAWEALSSTWSVLTSSSCRGFSECQTDRRPGWAGGVEAELGGQRGSTVVALYLCPVPRVRPESPSWGTARGQGCLPTSGRAAGLLKSFICR